MTPLWNTALLTKFTVFLIMIVSFPKPWLPTMQCTMPSFLVVIYLTCFGQGFWSQNGNFVKKNIHTIHKTGQFLLLIEVSINSKINIYNYISKIIWNKHLQTNNEVIWNYPIVFVRSLCKRIHQTRRLFYWNLTNKFKNWWWDNVSNYQFINPFALQSQVDCLMERSLRPC